MNTFYLNESFLFLDGHLLQLLQRTIEDVQIHLLRNTGKDTHIRVLPEFPVTLIFHRIYIVMGNPVRIRVKNGIVEVTGFKLIGSI